MPEQKTLYAHNQCPMCGAMDKPQTRGTIRRGGQGYLETRTCSVCKASYDYVPVVIVAPVQRKPPRPSSGQTAVF